MAKPTVEVMPEAALADAIRGWKRGRNADAAQSVLGFLGGSVAGPEAQARIEAAGRTAGLDASERAELRRELTDQLVRLQESQAGTRAAEAKARGDIASERARAARDRYKTRADLIASIASASAGPASAKIRAYGDAYVNAAEYLAAAPGTLTDKGDRLVRDTVAGLDDIRTGQPEFGFATTGVDGRVPVVNFAGNDVRVAQALAAATRGYDGLDIPEVTTAFLTELGVPSGAHGAAIQQLARAAAVSSPADRSELERIYQRSTTTPAQRQGEARAQLDDNLTAMQRQGVIAPQTALDLAESPEDAAAIEEAFRAAEETLNAPEEAEDPVAARIRQQLEALDQPEPPETVIAWKRQLQNTPTFKRFMEQNSFPDTERGREDAWDAARRAEGLMWRGKAEPSTRTIPDDTVKSDLGMAPPDDRARLTPSAELTAGSESGQAVAAPPAAPSTRPSARDVVSRIGTGMTAAGQALRGADESQPGGSFTDMLLPSAPMPTGRGKAAPTIAAGATKAPDRTGESEQAPPLSRLGAANQARPAESMGFMPEGVRSTLAREHLLPAPSVVRRLQEERLLPGNPPRAAPPPAEAPPPESEQAPYLTPEQRRRMTIDARLRALRAAGYAAPTE